MSGYLSVLIPSLPFSEPTTSREAALAMQPFAETQRDRLEAFYRSRGLYGATDVEVEVLHGIRRQSCCARRNELLKLGRVVKTDQRRSHCAVYVHVEAR